MTTANNEPDTAAMTLSLTIGARLNKARENRGLTIAEVAQSLRVTVTLVHCLEEGSWERLGPTVYGRGYVRAYARMLGIDAEDARECFDLLDDQISPPLNYAMPARRSMRHGMAASVRWMAYLAATALIAAPVAFWVVHAFRGAPTSLIATSAEMPASARDERAADKPMLASLGVMPTRTEQPEPSQPISVGDVALQADPEVSAPSAQINADERQLVLTFTEDAWLDVTDASGQRLAYGLIPALSERYFTLTHGLKVRLGNADAVAATLAGEPFDLKPHTSNDLATFDLPDAR